MKIRNMAIALLAASAIACIGDGVINVDLQPGPGGHRFSANHHGRGGLDDSTNGLWNAVMPPVAGYDSSWGSGGLFEFEGVYESSTLHDDAGVTTPVTISIHNGPPRGTTFAVNPGNTWAYDHVATDAKNLMSDYLIAPGGGTNIIRINNLKPGSSATLVLFGAGDQNTHRTTFAVGGQSLTTAGVPHEPHTLTEGVDYVVFRDVKTEDGSLVLTYTGAGASMDGNINGLQIRGEWVNTDKVEAKEAEDRP